MVELGAIKSIVYGCIVIQHMLQFCKLLKKIENASLRERTRNLLKILYQQNKEVFTLIALVSFMNIVVNDLQLYKSY